MSRLTWPLGLLGALGLAAGIVRPGWGVAGLILLLAALGVGAVAKQPERGLVFCLLAFPWYMAFRGMVILQFPIALFGVRFWAELALAAVFGGLALRSIKARRAWRLRWDDLPALTYLAMCLYGALATLLSKHILYLVYGFHFVLFPVLFYFAARWLRPDAQSAGRIVGAFVAGYVALALVSLWAFFTGPELVMRWNHAVRQQLYDYMLQRGAPPVDPVTFWRGYLRMQSLLFEENVWGSLCSFVSLLAVGMFVSRRRARGWVGLFFLATLGLALSVARGALVGWGVGMIALFLQRARFSWRLSASLAVVAALGGGVYLYASESPNIALWRTLGQKALEGIESGELDERTQQWREGWDILKRNPSGTGLGTVGYSASSTGLSQSKVADGNYISLGAELGWLGLAMLMCVLCGCLWTIARHLRALADPATRGLGLGLLAYLCAMSVHAVTANVFEYYYTFPAFWLLLGVYVTRCEEDAGRVA